MEFFLKIFIICFSAYMGRVAGGGFWGPWIREKTNIKLLPEIILVIPLIVVSSLGEDWVSWLLNSLFIGFGFQTGFGTARPMGYHPEYATSIDPETGKRRKQRLSIIVDPICRLMNWPLGSRQYCWLLFALKGLITGIPFGLPGLLLVVLVPASYQLGASQRNLNWPKRDWIIDEWLAAGSIGLVACLTF